jgi:segregation and condensation protein B
MDGSIRPETQDATEVPFMSPMSVELRMLEAMLFAAPEPVEEASLAERLPEGCDVRALLESLAGQYAERGVRLSQVAGKWAFRTAEDLAPHLRIELKVPRKLSRASVETLAIIAYHQPLTRGEIEEIRGVALSRGTLDVLLEIGWIKPVGRRRTPGRPVTWGTTAAFLEHFGLNGLGDLPGVDELKAAGLLDTRPVRAIFGEVAARNDAEANADSEADAEGDEAEEIERDGEDGESEDAIAAIEADVPYDEGDSAADADEEPPSRS